MASPTHPVRPALHSSHTVFGRSPGGPNVDRIGFSVGRPVGGCTSQPFTTRARLPVGRPGARTWTEPGAVRVSVLPCRPPSSTLGPYTALLRSSVQPFTARTQF